MAHLEVRTKPSRPWWIYALTIIILIALAAMVFKQCGDDPSEHHSIAGTNLNSPTENKAVAATVPDWQHIDFNSKKIADTTLKATDIYTQTDGNYTIYNLGENILFAVNSDKFSDNAKSSLESIAFTLKKRFPEATIGIFGNTDSTETTGDRKLGMLRAEAVRRWLATEGQINTKHLSVHSLGNSQPIANNDTKSGRQQNRNVAIVIFPKQSETNQSDPHGQ